MKIISTAKVGFKMKYPNSLDEFLIKSDKMLFRRKVSYIYE